MKNISSSASQLLFLLSLTRHPVSTTRKIIFLENKATKTREEEVEGAENVLRVLIYSRIPNQLIMILLAETKTAFPRGHIGWLAHNIV